MFLCSQSPRIRCFCVGLLERWPPCTFWWSMPWLSCWHWGLPKVVLFMLQCSAKWRVRPCWPVCLFVGESDFYLLLDIWFPDKKPLPTAFLVDTSEEALLLPDWLKLRMIRSEVSRLVDAGTTCKRAQSLTVAFCSVSLFFFKRTLSFPSTARSGASAAAAVCTVFWHSSIQHE